MTIIMMMNNTRGHGFRFKIWGSGSGNSDTPQKRVNGIDKVGPPPSNSDYKGA